MRLLLVEDEVDLAIAIQKKLQSHNYVVDWVEDGNIAWDYLQVDQVYSLAIFDWMIPGISGLELCQQLRQQQQTLPILILSARDRLEDRVVGLDAGADDYLIKPFGMEELLARIRALLRRPSIMHMDSLDVGGLMLNYQNFSVATVYHAPIELTAKEFQLLEYFMQHPGQILSHEQIRSRLWDLQDESISNIVAAQVRLLRRKLETIDHQSCIETIRGLGYRFNPANA